MVRFLDEEHRRRFAVAAAEMRVVAGDEAACLYVLTAYAGLWQRVRNHVDLSHSAIDWPPIRRIPFAHGELVLVSLAQRLWNNSGPFKLEDLWDVLDDRNWQLAMAALQIRRHGIAVIDLVSPQDPRG